ncbi:MAG: hypothetical protein ABIC40_00030 [bacterium]
MKLKYSWAVWLWTIQALTGLALVLYIVIHTIDNGAILISPKNYEDMLHLWHSMPGWFYVLMVLGLTAVFIVHMLNGIRIASNPYKQIDISSKHAWMLKHPGTYFWLIQVLTGSIVAIFAVWHLIVQHGSVSTMTSAQSAIRITPTIFLLYTIFLAAVMYHAFNGCRSVLIKLGIMTDKAKESILVGLVALAFYAFFFTGVLSMGKFLLSHHEYSQAPPKVEISNEQAENQSPIDSTVVSPPPQTAIPDAANSATSQPDESTESDTNLNTEGSD